VRRRGVGQVNPGEERSRTSLPQPGQRAGDHLTAAALRFEGPAAVAHIAHDLVVIAIESAIESETMVEDERADEGTGAVAGARENRRQRFTDCRKRSDAVVAHP